ncbi:STAS-like domain-containing protein [Cytobacillus oceanisediminis]|uniref:STAS-like domain-containing protein n=1 Tax=Cytobacillus oceanisediminis TaxID=665099 RepID=UPI00203E4A38|nr:STAS-like domain-containing protein [Cytobacillus oceanisediminis]MCM3404270.1 STAS-like domain-containing protein [Cytobacillus oceanisediminis]
MVFINILDHVEKCYSNADGDVIYYEIKKAFDHNSPVTVSFKGVTSLNSSFVNSAFIELLNDFDFSYIRQNLKFTNSTAQINSIIKNRFSFEVNKKNRLAVAF